PGLPSARIGVACAGVRPEPECVAVDAVAQTGRLRPVGEYMPEVGVARGTTHLGTPHEPPALDMLLDRIVGDRPDEARPSGPRVELVVGAEQRSLAADAGIGARRLQRVVGMAKWGLGAVRPCDDVLGGGEFRPPLGIGLRHLCRRPAGACLVVHRPVRSWKRVMMSATSAGFAAPSRSTVTLDMVRRKPLPATASMRASLARILDPAGTVSTNRILLAP